MKPSDNSGEGAKQEPESGPSPDRRRFRRSDVIWAARVQTASGTRIECEVLDLSAAGAKLHLDQPLAAGELVTFISPRFDPVSAKVAWVADGHVGLEFLEGVDRVMSAISGKTGVALEKPRRGSASLRPVR
jgi:hypothetical protein